MENTKKISQSLFDLLNEKVKAINKKSTLQRLLEKDIKELKSLEIVVGVYSCKDDNNNDFLVYKIFIISNLLVKGYHKEFNLISNALLSKNKNKDKERIAAKINIYHNSNNQLFYDTIIKFVCNKINEEDLKQGEYILEGLKLGDLLEIEI